MGVQQKLNYKKDRHMIQQALEYPLIIFKNKYVLKVMIHACWIQFLLLTFSNLVYHFIPNYFNDNVYYYSLLKDIIYQTLTFTTLGYFISKYKFCIATLVSFYGVLYILMVWFISKYLFSFSKIMEDINISILIILGLTVVYNLSKKVFKIN